MCGIPIAAPGAPGGPLASDERDDQQDEASEPADNVPANANDTIAMPMVPAQARVVATMAQQAIQEADVRAAAEGRDTSDPNTDNAVTARPAPRNLEAGKTTHGVGLNQPLPEMVREAPRQAETKKPSEPPQAVSAAKPAAPKRREETWEREAASADSPFGTSTSVSLKGIGLPSARQRILTRLGLGLLLMSAGALFMYFAMQPTNAMRPDNEAQETGAEQETPVDDVQAGGDPSRKDDDIVLGEPLPIDEVAPAEAGGTQDPAAPDPAKNTTQNKATNKNSKSTKTSSSSGSSKNNTTSNSKTNQPGGTDNTASKPDEVDETKNDPAPADAPQERDLELEMYSSRVRYAVSRYYAARAQSCFDNITKNVPDLRGTVQVAFKIAESGQVSGSRVAKNTTGHAGLGTCLVSQVNSWRLPPPPEANIELQMPFSR